jgi:hypothetical protein
MSDTYLVGRAGAWTSIKSNEVAALARIDVLRENALVVDVRVYGRHFNLNRCLLHIEPHSTHLLEVLHRFVHRTSLTFPLVDQDRIFVRMSEPAMPEPGAFRLACVCAEFANHFAGP